MTLLRIAALAGVALLGLTACQRDAEIGLSAERSGPQVLNPQPAPPTQ